MSTNWFHDLLFGSNESKMKALEQAQQMDAEQFQSVQEYLSGLQENFTGLEEKVETLTEAVGEQEKIMAICIIVSAVAAIAITSFVAFCIYQGVKCEREKEKNLSKDMPDAKLNNVDVDSTKKLPENTLMAVE